MATSDKIAVNWNLKNVDKNEVFRPQFAIGDDGVNIEISSSIAEQQRFGFLMRCLPSPTETLAPSASKPDSLHVTAKRILIRSSTR